jgi:hypothetical protein
VEPVLNFITLAFASLYGIAAIVSLCAGIYWLLNKKAKQKQLAELRARLDELRPTDPEYNQVRALYTAMMIDAHRWDFSHGSDTGGDGSSHHSDRGYHSAGHHSGDGSHSD